MTCGICNPMAFRPTEKTRVYGYTVAGTPQEAINASRGLFFAGCQQVFCDTPTGRVLYRPQWVHMCKIIRRGDKVVLSSFAAVGDRAIRQAPYLDHLDGLGADVFELSNTMNELFPETTTEDAAA